METKRRIHKKCGNIVVSAIFVAAILTFALAPIASAAGAGNALDFDGSNDYVECGNDASLTEFNNFTMEAWVYLEDSNSNQKILGKFDDWDNYYIMGVGSGVHYSQLNASGQKCGFATGNVSSNEWTHLAVTFSKGNGGTNGAFYGYVNGQIVYSKTDVADAAISVSKAAYPFRIGVAPWDINAFKVDGQIDEVRIWNDARTEAEIRENMCKTLVGDESGLVAYYKMTDGSGTSLTDNSTNSNTGTLINMEDGDWVTSTAAIGDKSHYGTGTSNLAENSDVPVDIAWNGDTPGANAIFDAIQNDDAPDVTTGLLTHYPSTYWELWIANNDSFKADVKFHYDDIGGIGKEAALSLYTRSEADESWIAVTDITRDDEGDNTNGVGSITANNLTGFSQFIITSDDPANPVPELPTVVLFSIGVLMLVVYAMRKRF
jgi:hypothetical protein